VRPVGLRMGERTPGDDDGPQCKTPPSGRRRGSRQDMSIPSAGITRIRFYGSRAAALLSARRSGLPVLVV
jgi:hypothetical protein